MQFLFLIKAAKFDVVLRVIGVPFIHRISVYFLIKISVNQEPSHCVASHAYVVSKSDSQNRDYLKMSVSKYLDQIQKLVIPSFWMSISFSCVLKEVYKITISPLLT